MTIEEIEKQIVELQKLKENLLIERCLPFKGKFYLKTRQGSPSQVCRILVPDSEWVPVWLVSNYLPYGAAVSSNIIQRPASNLMPSDFFGRQVSVDEALSAVRSIYEKASEKAITDLIYPNAFGVEYNHSELE